MEISSSDLEEMSIDERIQLVEVIWNSIIETPGTVEIPEWHQRELERRFRGDPVGSTKGSSWDEVQARILNR